MCARAKVVAADSAKEVCPEATLLASVGVAFYPDDGEDAEQLLVAADKRMYSMKQDHRRAGAFVDVPMQTPMTQ
jgi:GGDEF domain-containing protein